MTTKLYRSNTDRRVFGVCGGLSEMLNVDSALIRFGVVVGTIFSGGTVGLLYLVAGFVIPEEPAGYGQHRPYGFGYETGDPHAAPKGRSHWGGGHSKHRKSYHGPYTGHGMNSHTGTHMGSEASSMHGGFGEAGGTTRHASDQQDELDALMREVETKALRREIEELKERLAKYENQNDQKKGE